MLATLNLPTIGGRLVNHSQHGFMLKPSQHDIMAAAWQNAASAAVDVVVVITITVLLLQHGRLYMISIDVILSMFILQIISIMVAVVVVIAGADTTPKLVLF